VRAPAEFLVTRHLITHPDDGPSDIARHERIHVPTASSALIRIRAEHNLWTETQLLAHIRNIAERPKWRAHSLRLPNPQRWVDNYDGRKLISGEPAAVLDGFDLIPERHLVYLEAAAMNQALQFALDEGGALAPLNQANLTLRTMDRWLYEEPIGYAERGQRLLDYADSKHVQLLRGLKRLD
jgi:hypothetical protein